MVWRVNVIIKGRRRRLDSSEINLRKVKLKHSKNRPILRAVQMLDKETQIHRQLNNENVGKVEKLIYIYDNVSGFPKSIFHLQID